MDSVGPHAAPARSERAQRTRQRILDAAGQCFANGGYAKTTVEEIAARAGVSKALVYHHFRGKEQVLEAALERTLAEWDAAGRADGPPADGSVAEGLAHMLRSGLAYARTNPMLRAFFQLDPLVLVDVRRSAAVRDELERFRVELVETIRTGVESGELRADLDVERTAELVRILHLAFIEGLLNPEWIDASDERLVEVSLDVLFHGLVREKR